jgi:putative peptide zinc metalloprotease protein
MAIYTPDTVVIVENFSCQHEGTDVIIGRAETGVFLAVPQEGIELLEDLAAGKNVGEASDQYRRKYGAMPDVDDFLSLMESNGIVKRKTNGNDASMASVSVSVNIPQRGYHFGNFPQRIARWLFGRTALVGVFALATCATGAVIIDPSLIPQARDLYFPDHRTLSALVLALASYATIFVHEFGHLIAARALGVNSRMGIGHRLWYLVAETDLTGLWAVPKRQRYLPLLAGVVIDIGSASLLVMLLLGHTRGLFTFPVLTLRLVKAMVLTYALRVIWQFFFYIRTDFYYVFANLVNCKNLLKDTEDFVHNQLARFIPSIHHRDQSGIPPAELRIVRGYALFWLAGRIFAVAMLFVVTIPVLIRYLRNLAQVFRTGYSVNPGNFLDALLLATLFLVPLVAGFAMWTASLIRGKGN